MKSFYILGLSVLLCANVSYAADISDEISSFAGNVNKIEMKSSTSFDECVKHYYNILNALDDAKKVIVEKPGVEYACPKVPHDISIIISFF